MKMLGQPLGRMVAEEAVSIVNISVLLLAYEVVKCHV